MISLCWPDARLTDCIVCDGVERAGRRALRSQRDREGEGIVPNQATASKVTCWCGTFRSDS